jgi:hypothetical protein
MKKIIASVVASFQASACKWASFSILLVESISYTKGLMKGPIDSSSAFARWYVLSF